MEPSWDDIEAFLGRLGPSWGHPGPSWRRIGAVLALLWAGFEASTWEIPEVPKTQKNLRTIVDFCFPGDPPGRLPGRLGSLPGPLGALLGRLGIVMGPAWKPLGPSRGSFAQSGGVLVQSGAVRELSWAVRELFRRWKGGQDEKLGGRFQEDVRDELGGSALITL